MSPQSCKTGLELEKSCERHGSTTRDKLSMYLFLLFCYFVFSFFSTLVRLSINQNILPFELLGKA